MNFEAMNEEMKERLMAYLYGEMSKEEQEQIALELAKNPALQAALNELKSTQTLLQGLEEESVSTPPFFQLMSEEAKPKNQAFKWVGSIAAAILLLFVFGKITGLHMTSTGEGFEISFNKGTSIKQKDYVAKADVNNMIQASLAAYDKSLNQQLADRSEQQEALINDQFEASRALLSSSVESIASNNQSMLQNYWVKNSQQQEAYMNSLMGDFTNYVEQRRSEDMQYLVAKINLLETDTDLLELETNQIKNTYALNENNNTY